MKPIFWSVLLQWSRFGTNAVVFLIAARFLSLKEFGAFATAFGAIKLAQGFHKSGISEAVVIKKASALRLNTLFALSSISGVILAGGYLTFAAWFGANSTFLFLAIVPVVLGFSAISDGLLRKRLNIRGLALRTFFSQIIAASIALIALRLDAGATALVIFTVLNVVLSGTLSIIMAGWYPTKFPSLRDVRLTLKTVLQIAGRDSLNSGILPLSQITIGIFIGLPEAGAFQIATRILSMIDALTLAPLRYLILPKFAVLKVHSTFKSEIHKNLKLTVSCACWVWFGLASSTIQVLELVVGAEHATTVTPILHGLIPLGFSTALAMTFTQALMARGETHLVLKRAVITFGVSLLLTLFALGISHQPTSFAIALSSANLVVLAWFLKEASSRLSFPIYGFTRIFPPIFAGIIMFLSIYQMAFPLGGQIIAGTLVYVLTLSLFNLKIRSWSWI
jgi:O-antigen/teichoic acid export membrane protein